MTETDPKIENEELIVCPLCLVEKSHAKIANVKRHIKEVHKGKTHGQKRTSGILTHFFTQSRMRLWKEKKRRKND